MASDPALRTSRSDDRDNLVQEYRDLDRKMITHAAAVIVRNCRSRRPRGDVGEAGIIQREAERKTKHMPVRQLIDRTRSVTQAIKPCFMMSPLSVSQFLPPDISFDVVIFDEASQVSPADAINCIYRGKALITAGDKQQLPPTSFFAGSGDDEDRPDEGEDDAPDLGGYESILDLTKSAGAFRSLTLRWHYRSRHEDLISFSNASFYRNRLITFPGAHESGADIGVELFAIDGVYRRSGPRDNPAEAEFVAKRVMHHYETRPDMSLGVVAFSETQAACIENAVEAARAANPQVDRFFTEDRLDGFFVKNLESVQGDERDVMIFSIGYGPDETGKLTMNFGPLNRNGGQRRLNVAVTRARYRNEIVSSITASDITSSSNSESIRHFRRYLDFAARGPQALALDVSHGGDAESPFEESVIEVVRSWGYGVQPQVGVAGYRIDMAVRHPDHHEVFVIGIECDGFQYHSSKVARDRDRLRESVLNGLGWNLHRIWSTAWNRNRAEEEARLRTAIETAASHPIKGLLTQKPAPSVPHLDSPATEPEIEDASEAVTEATVSVPEPRRSSSTRQSQQRKWALPYVVTKTQNLRIDGDPAMPHVRPAIIRVIEKIVQTESPIHKDLLDQRLREILQTETLDDDVRDNITEAIRESAKIRQYGHYIGIPNSPVERARTPIPECTRTIDQIHDAELAVAVVHLIHESGDVETRDLMDQIAEIFDWPWMGADAMTRLDAVIDKQVAKGNLMRNGSAVAPAKAWLAVLRVLWVNWEREGSAPHLPSRATNRTLPAHSRHRC